MHTGINDAECFTYILFMTLNYQYMYYDSYIPRIVVREKSNDEETRSLQITDEQNSLLFLSGERPKDSELSWASRTIYVMVLTCSITKKKVGTRSSLEGKCY